MTEETAPQNTTSAIAKEIAAAAPIDVNNPEVKALIEQAVSGLTKSRDEILNEKKILQSKLKEMEKTWEGVDVIQVKSLLERMKNDEETKLIANGKIDEVFNKRIEYLKKDYDARINAGASKIDELATTVSEKEKKIKELVIDGVVRNACSEVGVVPSAIEDVLWRAKNQFQLTEQLHPIARDPQGKLIMGRSGKDPITVAEWVETMKEKCPHWFPNSSGIGATGSFKNKGGAFVISREDAKNPQKYREAKAAAAKAGQTLQIIYDT